MKRLRLRLRSLLRPARVERELSSELEFHLEQQIAENLAAGMSAEEARYAALRTIGGLAQFAEECRDARRVGLLQDLGRDLRYGARTLRRNPVFAAVAVFTLALGIGASTAIFSIVKAVLLEPLRYPDADRIVALNTYWKRTGHVTPRVSGDLADLLARHDSFDALGSYYGGEVGVQLRDRAEFSGVYVVNPDFLRVFSVMPACGRLLEAGDADRGAVVSAGFARRLFGSEQSALGQTVSVEHQIYQIVGVLPGGFEFPAKAELWLAAPARLWNLNRSAYNYKAVAKLKPGVGLEAAQAELDAIAARLAAAFPETNRDKTFLARPLRAQLVAPVGTTLWVLMAAVSLVLLIACANVANLLLARAAGRAREIALRAALGASRRRILRQLTAESLLLAALAGALALLLAASGTPALLRLAPENLPRLGEVRVDWFVLLFAAAAALASTLLFGLAPAWQATRVDLNEALKQGGPCGPLGGRSGRLRTLLVVAEISLSFVLASGAALLFRSFLALTAVNLGYRTEGVLVMYAHLPAHGQEEYVRAAQEVDRLLPEFATIPGVKSAAAAMGVPTGRYGSNGSYFVEGAPTANPPNAAFLLASPGYFATMGIPLRRGREFTSADRYDAPFVAIVNQALAKRSFAAEDPIGRRIHCGLDSDKWMTVVGVVGDVRQDSPAAAPEPALYMPLQQHPYHANEFQLVMRTAVPPASLAGAARQKMRAFNPAVPTSFTTLEQMVASSIATPRFRTFLIGAFALVALLLAVAGVYGVMAYLTAQRTSEFALRLAMGAGPRDLFALVLGRAALLAAAGLTIGLAISVAASRLLATMLFSLKPTDPATYAAAMTAVLLVTLAAAAVPAWRAARLAPASALRE